MAFVRMWDVTWGLFFWRFGSATDFCVLLCTHISDPEYTTVVLQVTIIQSCIEGAAYRKEHGSSLSAKLRQFSSVVPMYLSSHEPHGG